MNAFNPRPNYSRLSKYYKFNEPVNILEQKYANGNPILITFYTEDDVIPISKRFFEICEKHGILENVHDLFYLVLSKIQEMEDVLIAGRDENEMLLRTHQLAGALLAFNPTSNNKAVDIAFKTPIEQYKIQDPMLSAWIGGLITKAVQAGEIPLTLLGMSTDHLFIDKVNDERIINFDKVKNVFDLQVKKTMPAINQLQTKLRAEFCYYIRPYLDGETIIGKQEGTNFSDSQLNFYYDIMVLFDLISIGSFDKSMDYEPKDYVRNMLVKYAKAFGIKGN